MSVFSSKKTQQGVYAAEEAKEKTQTESKQKACMGMEMEMPDSATFISGDICFSVAGLLGYGIFYLCQNESSRNTQKELQGIRGESKKLLLRLNPPHGIHLPPAY